MIGQAIGAVAGSVIGGLFQKNAAAKQAALQKQFAKNSVQWRVEDAQKAGIHPLAALGMQSMSYQPQQVGDTIGSFGQIGANLGQALDSGRNEPQRVAGNMQALQGLAVERAGLENELLRSQIARTRQMMLPPAPSPGDAFLLDGQSQSGLVTTKPMERVSTAPGNPTMEAGAIPDLGFSRTTTGYAPQFSSDLADRMDENHVASLSWMYRNQLLPSIGLNQNPPNVPVPEGYDAWIYSPFAQEYRPHKKVPYLPFYY